MATTLQNRIAVVAGTLFAAAALLVLSAGVAQARPSLPQLIQHHSHYVTVTSGGSAGGATTGAAAPFIGGRSATGGRTVAFAPGRFAPVTTTAGSTAVYAGLGALILVLAGLATGLIVSERRSRSLAPASASGTAVSPMSSAKPAGSASSEGSQEKRRKAA